MIVTKLPNLYWLLTATCSYILMRSQLSRAFNHQGLHIAKGLPPEIVPRDVLSAFAYIWSAPSAVIYH